MIITLRLLGFLQWIEWTHYDSLFYFSRAESPEERIVIVGWDEEDLRRTRQTTMSDQTLVSVLEKIIANQPRLIGLDLYRDIPVPSIELEKAQNQRAYNRLQTIFLDTPNLIGIEKVLEPEIAPPQALKQKRRVFSSDLITDSDNIVRRVFIDPQPLRQENDLSTYWSIPYLGTKLGTKYLNHEGWKVNSLENGSLRIFKDESQVILSNLKNFDGGYINNSPNLDFLVNWRRGHNLFETVSVDKLMKGKIQPNFFFDKIVLIGTIAASTADRHYLPIIRWNKDKSWSYGLYIPAHVASSIISAVKDSRPTIKVAPWGTGYLLLFFSVIANTVIMLKFSHLTTRKIYRLSSLFSLGLIGILGVASLFFFQVGWWIPIVPAILGILLSFIVINNYSYIDKEQKTILKLESISIYLTHKLGNSIDKIRKKTKRIGRRSRYIHDYLYDEYLRAIEAKAIDPLSEFGASNESQSLAEIEQKIEEIFQEIEIIQKYEERTTQFIRVTRNPKKLEKTLTDINEFVGRIVRQTKIENDEKELQNILIKEVYDPNLKQAYIDRTNLEIILENLINNAFDAVQINPQLQSNYIPLVEIQTKKRNNLIEISVIDNGVGMSKQRQGMIFAPFVSFKLDRGQGIGLSLVKNILTLEKGNIKVESQPGKGSNFTVVLPLYC